MSIYIKSRKHNAAHRLYTSLAVSALAFAAPLSVNAQQNSSSTGTSLPQVEVTENKDSYKAERISSPKFTQPLVDTTQTVTVIKKELMQSQQATTLTEALQNSAGVGTFNTGEGGGGTNTGDAVFMRGFSTANSIFVDNIRDTAGVSRDLFNIDQVEVVKGPAGADNGRGAPTGYINMVTKQPMLENAYSGAVTYGTGDQKRVTADLNRQIEGVNGAAFRLNLMKQDSGVPGRDRVANKRWGIAPSFAIGLGTPTRILFDYLHVQRDNVPDAGIPTIGAPGYFNTNTVGKNPARVRSANYYGTANDYDRSTTDMFTTILEHDLNANVTLRNIMRYGKSRQNYLIVSPNLINAGDANPANWTIARPVQTRDQENEILTNQTNATIKFNTGSVKHAVTTGLEFIREKQTTVPYAGTAPAANVYAPNPYAPASVAISPTGARNEGTTNTIGVYLFDTLELTPSFQLNGGLRLDHYTTDFHGIALSTATSNPTLPVGTRIGSSLRKTDTLRNWKIGALYKLAPNGNLYAAYATSQQPPGGAAFALNGTPNGTTNSADNVNLAPQRTGTAEIGTKWEVFSKKLLLSAALFRTEVSNEITQDAVTSNLFVQSGKKRVEGIELGASGEIVRNWSINASVALMNANVSSGTTNPSATANQNNAALSFAPKKALSLWTTYALPTGVTIGGGVRYIDALTRTASTTISGVTNTPYAQSYWIADAVAAYQISKNVNLQLNLYNLANQRYTASLNNNGNRYIPGAERSAKLSLNLAY